MGAKFHGIRWQDKGCIEIRTIIQKGGTEKLFLLFKKVWFFSSKIFRSFLKLFV